MTLTHIGYVDYDGGRKAIREKINDCCNEVLHFRRGGFLPMNGIVMGISAAHFNENYFLTQAEIMEIAMECVLQLSPDNQNK